MGSDPISKKEGPMAMTYEIEMGWVAETLGPTSGHWKRRACVGQAKGKEKLERMDFKPITNGEGKFLKGLGLLQ